MTEPKAMGEEDLDVMECIVRHSAQPEATHRHWFPSVHAFALCREIRRLRAEVEEVWKPLLELAQRGADPGKTWEAKELAKWQVGIRDAIARADEALKGEVSDD